MGNLLFLSIFFGEEKPGFCFWSALSFRKRDFVLGWMRVLLLLLVAVGCCDSSRISEMSPWRAV